MEMMKMMELMRMMMRMIHIDGADGNGKDDEVGWGAGCQKSGMGY